MFTSIRANPFLRWEFRTRTTSAKINWSFILLRVIPLSFLTLVALIPVFYYIDESRLSWLGWMALILFVPRPILMLRAVVSAVASVKAEMDTHRWDLLILTGISAQKIIKSKWIGVIRQTAFDHMVFSLLHIGLALGISEYLNVMIYAGYQRAWPTILNSYIYEGWWLPNDTQVYPSLTVLVIGCIITSLFGLVECGFVAAIGLAMTFVWKQRPFAAYIASSAYYFGVLLLIAITWNYIYIGSHWSSYREMICDSHWLQECDYKTYRNYARITDTIQLGFQTPIDQATLLSANIMRPNSGQWYWLGSNTYSPFPTYDNRPFVARNLVAALLGMSVYGMIIRYFLRRATRFAIVNHGASGYLAL